MHNENKVHYKMEYYSSARNNKIMKFAVMYMKFKTINLSEVSQTNNDKYCVFSLICKCTIYDILCVL